MKARSYLSPSSTSLFKKYLLLAYLVALGLGFGTWDLYGDLVPWPGIEPGSLHWDCRKVATGLSGKGLAGKLHSFLFETSCSTMVE